MPLRGGLLGMSLGDSALYAATLSGLYESARSGCAVQVEAVAGSLAR
jgi:hypothetical protein